MVARDRQNILVDLSSEDDELRRLAVERATLLPAQEAFGIILECLGDPSWRVRKAAVERVAAMRDPSRCVTSLIRALGDGDNAGRRNAALEALTGCGTAVLPALLEASRDEDVDVRKQVVDALGGIADPSSIDRLCGLLRDADPNVRGAAADALGQSRESTAGPALLRAAHDDTSRLVRLSALRALAQLGVPVAPVELAGLLGDPSLRPAVYALLGASDHPEAEEWLLKGLSDASRSSREAAMEALARSAAGGEDHGFQRLASRVQETVEGLERLVPDAVERLSDAPPARRLALVQFLGLLSRPDTVEPLLHTGIDETLREPVLSSLESFGTRIEELVDAIFDGLTAPVQSLAVELLGRTGGETGARRLDRVLACSDPELKSAAARSLGRRRAVHVLPRLVSELKMAAEMREPDQGLLEALSQAVVEVAASGPTVHASSTIDLLAQETRGASESFRVVAARTMGGLGRPEDAERIGSLLSDPSERVRRVAAEALGRVARGSPPEPLRLALSDESSAVRIGAASALGGVGGPEAIDDLVRLGRDDDERVRAVALRALGTCLASRGGSLPGTVRTVLESALEQGGAVALSGLHALKSIGGETAFDLARSVLEAEDPELVRAAVECLGRHALLEEIPGLGRLLSHGHWSVRAQTVEELGERGSEPSVPLLLRRFEREDDEFVRRAILRALDRLEQ